MIIFFYMQHCFPLPLGDLSILHVLFYVPDSKFFIATILILPHNPSLPPLNYTNAPALHHPIIPTLHYSNTPMLLHSTTPVPPRIHSFAHGDLAGQCIQGHNQLTVSQGQCGSATMRRRTQRIEEDGGLDIKI